MSWRNLRSISTDPLSNFLSKLSQDQILKEAKDESAISDLDETKVIGITNHSICEIRSFPVPYVNDIDPDRQFYSPREPDLDRLRYHCKFDSGADAQVDYSLFGSYTWNIGYCLPVQITSPTWSEGLVGGRNAIMYNNTADFPKGAKAQFGTEAAYVAVADTPHVRLKAYLDGTIPGYDGFTISMLVRPMQIYNDTSIAGVEGWNRRLCMKVDEVPVQYGYEVRIAPNGALIVIFRRDSVDYSFFCNTAIFPAYATSDFLNTDFSATDFSTSGAGTTLANVDNYWTQLDISFKFSDNSITVRKNAVTQSLTAFPEAPNWTEVANHPTHLLINAGRFSSSLFGDRPMGVGITEWADFRIYAGVMTQQESTNLYTNKYTITDIPLGSVAISDYMIQPDEWTGTTEPAGEPPVSGAGAGPDNEFGITTIYTVPLGGASWASTEWDNGVSRSFQFIPGNVVATCYVDSYQTEWAINGVGNPFVTIDGTGIMRAGVLPGLTGSPRATVLDTWTNVESTVYVRCPAFCLATSGQDMRVKTDHYCVPGGVFGGYITGLDFKDQDISIRKEQSHAIGYSTTQATVPFTLAADTWYGIKAICYNISGGRVKLETWVDTTNGVNGGDWHKITEAIDDGTWGGSGGPFPATTGSAQGSAIRSNIGTVDGYIEYKWWSIKEINPPSGVPDTPDYEYADYVAADYV